MSMLRASTIEPANREVARRRVDRARTLRIAMFGATGQEVPAGFVRLTAGDDKRIFLKQMARQALRESEGFAPGDPAVRAVQHPAVQQAAAEEQANDPPAHR